MRRFLWLVPLLILQAGISKAQNKILEYTAKDLYPSSFEVHGDTTGNIAVHYIQRGEIAAYKSYFLFPAVNKVNRLELPYAVSVQGVGYTNDHFIFCVMRRNENRQVPQSKIILIKTDKAGKFLLRNVDIDLSDEKEVLIFEEAGVIYTLSKVKKGGIRLRRIQDLEIELFDFEDAIDWSGSLADDGVYLSGERESDYVSPSRDKRLTFVDGKLLMILKKYNRKDMGNISVAEFALHPTPTIFVQKVVNLPRKSFDAFPFRGKLFVFEEADETGSVSVFDMRSWDQLRKFQIGDDDPFFQKGQCSRVTGVTFLRPQEPESCEPAEKRKRITQGSAWIQAFPAADRSATISYGGYSNTGGMISIQQLSVTLSTDNFLIGTASVETRGTLLRAFATSEKMEGEGRPVLSYAQGIPYLIKFDKQSNALVVWK